MSPIPILIFCILGFIAVVASLAHWLAGRPARAHRPLPRTGDADFLNL